MAGMGYLPKMEDSQQNLVEVYTRRRFIQKRTTSEKYLAAAALALFILFLAFFILFLVFHQYYYQIMNETICTSGECIESALMLLQSVNFSHNPCDDFYYFACGKFGQEHPIADSYSHNSWFLEKEVRLNKFVQKILEGPIRQSDLKCVKRTKLFYKACVNETELNQLGLNPLFELLELVELPRFVAAKEKSDDFHLGKSLALAQRHLSQDILVTLSLGRIGMNNDTQKNATVLRLSPGLSGLNIFNPWKPNGDILGFRKFVNLKRGRNRDKSETNRRVKRLTPKKVIRATISFITDVLEEISKEIDQGNEYNTTDLIATAFKIVTFSSQLVKDWNKKHNESDNGEEQQMTLSTLQTIMDEENASESPSNKIDWSEYMETLFENVNVSYNVYTDVVIVENVEYFKFLGRVLGEANPLSVQRHVWWKLVEEFGRYTTFGMRNAYAKYSQALYGETVSSSRSQTCTSVMRRLMNIALSHQMGKFNNFSIATQKVSQMLKDIEKVFESIVQSLTWMDPETKFATLDKAQSVKEEIGYPSWLLNSTKVEAYYETLELRKSEYLKNIMRINEWEVEKVLRTIGPDGEAANDTMPWFSNPLQVNAFYSRLDNAISIPPGILQTPFYFRGLESLNYGAIGSILGHELTHGFDIDGKNYNKFGEKVDNLWPDEVTMEYENRAKCFIDQYEKYQINRNKILNGTVTLAENIADNGGIRESFKAYKLYTSRHGKEPKLPGFENFTHDQLLFLSFANIWCEETKPIYHLAGEDTHSPHRIRVVASLQNMKEFSEAYSCPPGSFMNPSNKCILW